MRYKLPSLLTLILSLYVLSFTCHAVTEPALEIRKINPPKLEAKYIKKRILCYRPMRRGSPAMFLEKRDNKVLVHNYGHGGCGLTLAPGAAKYVVGLLDKELGPASKDKPIVVLGGGVIGLFTALELVDKGYSHITVMAADFDHLTSHNAGGLLAPASMDNDPIIQTLIDQIGVDAYNYYKQVAIGQNQLLKKGATIMTTYFGTRETSTLEPYVRAKVMQPAKDVVLDFQNGTKRKMIAYDDGIFMDTDELMAALKNALNNEVVFKKRIIHHLSEIDEKIIINCSGMGAKDLMNDLHMVQVQGHLMLLKNQNSKDINYMLSVYVDGGLTSSGTTVKRKCSLFPKKEIDAPMNDVGVIGGTFIEGADDSTPNLEQFAIELANAQEFFGVKKNDPSFAYN